MSMTQEFDPKNWRAQRRERLRRLGAAGMQPAWPKIEKVVVEMPQPKPVLAPVIKPIPVQEVPEPPRKSQFWFRIVTDEEPNDTTFRPTIREIQVAVARVYGLATIDLRSARRTANIVRPRQIAMYLAKILTTNSLPQIGRQFGGRDHTTVLHAVRKITCIVVKDATVAREIAAFKERLGGKISRSS